MSRRRARWFASLALPLLLATGPPGCTDSAEFQANKPTGQVDWLLVDLRIRPPTPAGASLSVVTTFGLARHTPGEALVWHQDQRHTAGEGSYDASLEPLFFADAGAVREVLSADGAALRSGRVSRSGDLMAASSRAEHALMVGVRAADAPDPASLAGQWAVHLLLTAEEPGGQRAVTGLGRVTVAQDPASGDMMVSATGALTWPEPAPDPLPVFTGVRLRPAGSPASLLRLGPPEGGLPTALRGPGVVSSGGQVMLFGLEATSSAASGLALFVRTSQGLGPSSVTDPASGRYWFTHLHFNGTDVVTSDGLLTFEPDGTLGSDSCYETTHSDNGEMPCGPVTLPGASAGTPEPLQYTVDADGAVAFDFSIPSGSATPWVFPSQIVLHPEGGADAIVGAFTLAAGEPPRVGTLKVLVPDEADSCEGTCFW